MEGWEIGLIIVVVLGLVAIAFGALRDRRLNERRRHEMLAPPQRSIPKFSPDSPTPDYLSELQARRPPSDAPSTGLTDETRGQLRAAIAQPGVTAVDVGYASTDLVTDPATGWSVLRTPSVLVSAAPVSVVRELLGILENQLPTGRPLVVVAPSIGQELIGTFEVNHIQRVITILPVVAPDDATRGRIAEATGATPMSHSDLQSGYNVPALLGSCATKTRRTRLPWPYEAETDTGQRTERRQRWPATSPGSTDRSGRRKNEATSTTCREPANRLRVSAAARTRTGG